MRISFRKRPTKVAGPRVNQWKGPRAVQVMEQRQRARRSQMVTKWRRALRIVGWLSGLAVVVGVAVTGSRALGPMIQRGLEIRAVHVEGIHHVTKQDVLDRLALRKGLALHEVSLSYLAERLRTHPWVKEATVERLPLHDLRVTILERTPAAVARIRSEHMLTDDEGVVLVRMGKQDEPALPLLTGLELKALLRDDARQRQRIQSSIALAKAMAHSVDGRIEIDMGDPAALVVATKGIRFQFGSDALLDQWERFTKVKSASKMPTLDGGKREGSEVDLRYENRVIVRERG